MRLTAENVGKKYCDTANLRADINLSSILNALLAKEVVGKILLSGQ